MGTSTSSNASSGGSGVIQQSSLVDDIPPREIPRHKITLLQQIGEGQFGEVSREDITIKYEEAELRGNWLTLKMKYRFTV